MYEQLSKPIHEINNGSLQLFIFSLLSNKLLSIRYLLVTSFLARKEGSNPKGTFWITSLENISKFNNAMRWVSY